MSPSNGCCIMYIITRSTTPSLLFEKIFIHQIFKKKQEKLKNFTSLFKIQHLHFHLTHVYFNMFHKLHQSFQTFQKHHLHYSKCLKTGVCIIQKFYLCYSKLLNYTEETALYSIILYFHSYLSSSEKETTKDTLKDSLIIPI